MRVKLTNGGRAVASLGVETFPDRKRPCLCSYAGNSVTILGYLHGPAEAEVVKGFLRSLPTEEVES